MFACGISEVSVTPWLGLPMPGYLTLRNAEGVLDDLYAKAVVFKQGEQTVAMLSVDALDLEEEDIQRIRERAFAFTGIPRENIMVCATHTHTGGPVAESFMTPRNEDYCTCLVNKGADAIALAHRNMQPAKIGFGKGLVEGIAFNRRYLMNDGSVKTNPGRLNSAIKQPAGPVDPDVPMMKIEDEAGNLLGGIVLFACHLDVVGGHCFSADFPGEMAKTLRSVYGPSFVSLFLNGCSGNINHINTSAQQLMPEHDQFMGKTLAGEVVKTFSGILMESNPAISTVTKTITIPLRTLKETDILEAKQILASEKASQTDKVFAEEILGFSRIDARSAEVEVQTFCIGDAFVTGFPGDVFVEFGLTVKKNSPYTHNFIASHTNGRYGYLPTKEAFAQGGYEVRTTRNNRLAENAGELIAKTMMNAMELKHA